MTEQTEQQSEIDSASPYTKIFESIGRADMTAEYLHIIGPRMGYSEAAVEWGQRQARNAVANGESGHRAIVIGTREMEEMHEAKRDGAELQKRAHELAPFLGEAFSEVFAYPKRPCALRDDVIDATAMLLRGDYAAFAREYLPEVADYVKATEDEDLERYWNHD